MSGIAGIFYRHSSIQPGLLDAMLDSMSHRGPDARQTWHEGNNGLASCLLRTTPESENESPITSGASGRYQLVWDGRIDNRTDLLELLHKVSLKDAPDTLLFLEAWQTWGKQALLKIEGDFSFALWDSNDRSLTAGRDRVGLKPFHYSWDSQDFCFSSEIKPLFQAMGRVPEADDEMVLSFISYRNFKETAHQRTFFKNINRLAPSHMLVLKDNQLTVERYDAWDLETELKGTPEELVAQFKEIFKQAVEARTRSNGRVTSLLSGGHDSSAITATAAASDANLEALNFYSEDPRMDERAYASLVAEKAGIPFHAFFAKTRNFSTGLAEFLRAVEWPMINTSRNTEPFEFLQNRGVRVVLTGEGGDEILDEFGFAADLLARGHFKEFMQKSASFSAEFNDNPGDFRRESVNQVLPESIKNLRRRVLGNVPPAWINKKTARETGFTSSVLKAEMKPRFRSYSQAATWAEATRPYFIMKRELEERTYALHGLEIRYPFLDRRLIQFMLSLPWQFRASGVRKQILKQAMRGLVPVEVLERTDKADHTSETDTALAKLLQGRDVETFLNQSGMMGKYMDFTAARKLVARYFAGQKDLRFEIWFLITMDQWLKQFNQGDLHEGQDRKEEAVPSASSY